MDSQHELYEKYVYTINEPTVEEYMEQCVEEIERDADLFSYKQMGQLLSVGKNPTGLVLWDQKTSSLFNG